MTKKRIALLGSTGSIGCQCLDVVSAHPDRFEVEILTARNNAHTLIAQAIQYQPNAVVIADHAKYKEVAEALASHPIKVYAGEESLCEIVSWSTVDLVVNALVGFAGLAPTLAALTAKKPVALANKETLVAGGSLVMESAYANKAPIIPVDSEHSALLQCLCGEQSEIEKLILTASGGPFLHTPAADLPHIRKEQALKHPNWSMGAKVTIDSASMMNKGLEVIEAHWLFGIPASKIEVLVHPQSIIHSMVQFTDGSVKAQLSQPDMRIPIQYALSFPKRISLDTPRMNFPDLAQLHFYAPDTQKFPCMLLAYLALEKGGNIPCALNAANEIAVEAFLHDKLRFHHIPALIQKVMEQTPFIAKPSFAAVQETNLHARELAQNLLKSL